MSVRKSTRNAEVTTTPVVETPVVETPVVETPVVETPVVEKTSRLLKATGAHCLTPKQIRNLQVKLESVGLTVAAVDRMLTTKVTTVLEMSQVSRYLLGYVGWQLEVTAVEGSETTTITFEAK